MLLVYDLPEFIWSLGLHVHLRNWKLSPLSLEKGTCTRTCSILYKICGHSQGSVGLPVDQWFLIIIHMEIFRRPLKTWMKQFRIRDGNLGLTCMEVLAQTIEVTKVVKKNSVERPTAGLWGVHSLRKVRRQERSKQRKEEYLARRKLFKRSSKAIVVRLCTAGFRNLWSWFFINFKF